MTSTQNNQQHHLHSQELEERKSLAFSWFMGIINVDDLFACAVCHSRVDTEHPLHCPECSKLFCGGCLRQWYSSRNATQRCPCCQRALGSDQFIYCRVYQEVNEMIERLPAKLDELIRLINQPLRVCAHHGKELLLFCEPCRECLCVKCLFGDPHRAHLGQISELEEARLKFQAIIDSEKNFLTERLSTLSKMGKRLESNEHDMVEENERIVENVNWATEQIVEKLRDGLHDRLKQHVEPVKAIAQQQYAEVEDVMQRAIELNKEQTCATVMMETFHLADAIKKMHSEPLPQVHVPNLEFVNPITPPFVELSFLIRDFSQKIFLLRRTLSEEQSVEGFTFRLKGHQDLDENGNEVIKLSLVVVDGYDVHDVKVICYPKQGSTVEPLVRVMDLKLNEDNTVLEFSDFVSMEGFLTEVTDVLNLRVKFRLWATYYHKCVHKDWYIGRLSGVEMKPKTEGRTRY